MEQNVEEAKIVRFPMRATAASGIAAKVFVKGVQGKKTFFKKVFPLQKNQSIQPPAIWRRSS